MHSDLSPRPKRGYRHHIRGRLADTCFGASGMERWTVAGILRVGRKPVAEEDTKVERKVVETFAEDIVVAPAAAASGYSFVAAADQVAATQTVQGTALVAGTFRHRLRV